MPPAPTLREQLAAALGRFATAPLFEAAIGLFDTLGYRSQRRLRLRSATAEGFLGTFDRAKTINPERALLADWQAIEFLFQLTDTEVKSAALGSDELPFDSKGQWDGTIIESYLFLALELKPRAYTRTELAGATRAFNRLFDMPAMLLFKHGDTLTLAVIDRRLHKRDESKDVLEKVTLIKDIRFAAPHRAHVEILSDLSFDELIQRHGFTNFVQLHAAWRQTLDIQELNKRFYQQLQHWYFWALGHVRFPADAPKDDGRDALSLIRLLTRLIFVWFIKEKGLVPDNLFDVRALPRLLRGFAPADPRAKGSVYYRAILQNLFFATLNQEPDQRGWRRKEQNFMAHSLYRHHDDFAAPATALDLFKDIPFLNGGLFECLDKIDGTPDKPRYVRIDGFSDRPDSQPVVPDFLFFGPEQDADLSDFYEETKKKSRPARVRGLLAIFHDFKFTIEENTPLEEDVALDPELLGRVFENLLAAYNPETRVTARKQTGSFYTPREIVDYMTSQALFYALREKISGLPDLDARLAALLAHDDAPNPFAPAETARLIAAIDDLKVLDPACGSGAFPMGVLHRLVHVLQKLDPGNARWKQRQLDKAAEIPDATVREHVTADIEQAFGANELGYGRKLYLIENCLYGVDIQPIAAQIAKLRFFISLVVEQRTDPKAPNRGIRPLPNLETKIVAANTLIGVERKTQQADFLTEDTTAHEELRDLRKSLAKVRDDHFLARTPKTKAKCREEDGRIRGQMSALLKKAGMTAALSRQLAAWDPYDQNAHADFFDNEWMFGLTEGFDIVIGNPPYVLLGKATFLEIYGAQFPLLSGKPDLYRMFIERSLRFLHSDGVLTFIVPNSLLAIPSAHRLREFITTQTTLNLVIDLSSPVFGAAVNNIIFLAGMTAPNGNYVHVGIAADENGIGSMKQLNRIQQSDWRKNPKCEWTIHMSGEGSDVVTKLSATAVPLDAILENMCLGMQVYHNTIHSQAQMDSRYLHSETKRGRWWLREYSGRHIEAFRICTEKAVPFVDYSAEAIYQKPAQRYFRGPRLILREIIGERLVVAYSEEEFAVNKSCYVLLSERATKEKLKAMLAILSSACVAFWVRMRGDKAKQALFPRITMNTLRAIPVPNGWVKKEPMLSNLVDQILAAKRADAGADTSPLEAEIDRHVYALYGLTPAEIKIVEESSR